MINLNTTKVLLSINGGSGSYPTNLSFVQNDNLVATFDFEIKNQSNEEINYAEVVSAEMLMKVNGSYIQPIPCSVSESSITVDVTNEAVANVGTVVCCLKVHGDDEQVFTTNLFTYDVVEGLYGAEVPIEEPEASQLNAVLAMVDSKIRFCVYDVTEAYENNERVLYNNAVYKANSDIPANTAFVEGIGEEEWTLEISLGQDGSDGTNGTDGADGINGLSAYEIAVNNGYVGTESEWISELDSNKDNISASLSVSTVSNDDDIYDIDVANLKRGVFQVTSNNNNNKTITLSNVQQSDFVEVALLIKFLNSSTFSLPSGYTYADNSGPDSISNGEELWLLFEKMPTDTSGKVYWSKRVTV